MSPILFVRDSVHTHTYAPHAQTVMHVLTAPHTHKHTHTEAHSLLWGTGVCVLLQAQVSGQQEQLTCLILSVMLFLHWKRNILSVPLTLRGRALSLITSKWGHMCSAAVHEWLTHMALYYHRWLFSLSNWLNILHHCCCCLCVSLIFSKPVSGNINVFWIICYCTSKVR